MCLWICLWTGLWLWVCSFSSEIVHTPSINVVPSPHRPNSGSTHVLVSVSNT